jgi:phage/plasmid-associated DNA primase
MLTTPEEMAGILNWALDGLADLKKNGDITDKPSV